MDALVLSDNLTSGGFETIEAAINDYENQMAIYAKEARLQTCKNELEMRDPSFSFQKLMKLKKVEDEEYLY